MPDTFTSTLRVFNQIISLAARHRVPAIYPYRYMAAAGGLLAYGTDNADLFRRVPTYVDHVLIYNSTRCEGSLPFARSNSLYLAPTCQP